FGRQRGLPADRLADRAGGLIREIRRRAKVSTRTTVVLQTFFENRAHPVVGQDGEEPANRAASP
ncbi:MAG TPA: hypothetical protein VF869_00605, partial [Jatrophihabitantaceae bacterium]